MSSPLKEEILISIQKELEAYLASKKSAKSYFTSMKELSEWLEKLPKEKAL